jgi:hypothetical protein
MIGSSTQGAPTENGEQMMRSSYMSQSDELLDGIRQKILAGDLPKQTAA